VELPSQLKKKQRQVEHVDGEELIKRERVVLVAEEQEDHVE
jgi:hypothetical protein